MGNLKEELKRIPDTPSKIKYLMFRHLKHFNCKVPEARALLNHAHNLPSEYFNVVSRKQKKYARILTDVLSELFNYTMDLDKLKATSYIMFGMCNSIMYWYDPDGSISLDELSDMCYDIFMDGMTSFITKMGSMHRVTP
jgi:hypothetical protein